MESEYSTKFRRDFVIEKSIFEKFVVFEGCEFGIKISASKSLKNHNLCRRLFNKSQVKNKSKTEDSKKKNPPKVATFTAVTFEGFANFRDTKFHNGLDIEKINLSKEVNFLHAEIEISSSKQETFRIIKNSFDKVGNYTEGNRFYSYEMEQHEKEVRLKGTTEEKIILCLNQCISSFGQSYLKPMAWFVYFALMYALLSYSHTEKILYKILPAEVRDGVLWLFNIINYPAANLPLFQKFLKSGMETLSLLFYIIFAALIWQIVVAVKRHTRR